VRAVRTARRNKAVFVPFAIFSRGHEKAELFKAFRQEFPANRFSGNGKFLRQNGSNLYLRSCRRNIVKHDAAPQTGVLMKTAD
jgi:hypothetical protein